MASPLERRAQNVPGALFVDETCIDCDTCRWLAPRTFDRSGSQARVHTQPTGAADLQRALQALVACPTGSIGTTAAEHKPGILAARESFPLALDGPVSLCGWACEASFGAASYLIRRERARGGNVLVDSPRFSRPLVQRLEQLGGVETLFLTQRDDVADHERFAAHFGCRRVLHARDVVAATRAVELQLAGDAPVRLDEDLLAIPVPGHTEGSTCLLFDGRYLFSGDHLAWSERLGQLYGFRSACWYDWDLLVRSTERLAAFDFEWVLPGHGRRAHFARERMRDELRRALAWMGGRAAPTGS